MSIKPSAFAPYADDIAFVAEEQPAATLSEFVTQLGYAARNLDRAGILGAEDLEPAATYLCDASDATGAERKLLLKRAAKLLSNVADMVDEYRLMV